MKARFIFCCGSVLLLISSCKNSQTRYLDLNTNQYIGLKKDSVSGYMMNSKTGEPVEIYADTKTHDTVSGMTGEIVNGRIYRSAEGKWIIRTNNEGFNARSESQNSAKVKVKDDKYKAKTGNYIIKTKDNGKVKVKPVE